MLCVIGGQNEGGGFAHLEDLLVCSKAAESGDDVHGAKEMDLVWHTIHVPWLGPGMRPLARCRLHFF